MYAILRYVICSRVSFSSYYTIIYIGLMTFKSYGDTRWYVVLSLTFSHKKVDE